MTRRFSTGDKVRTFEGDTGVVILVRGSGDYAHNYDYNVKLDTGEELNYWDDELSPVVSLVKDPAKINDAAHRGVCARPRRVELNFVSSPAEHDRECEGHESLRGDAMGAEVYCDGSCRPAWSALVRV